MSDEREIGDVFICCDQRDFKALCDCLCLWEETGLALPARFALERGLDTIELSARNGDATIARVISLKEMRACVAPLILIQSAVNEMAGCLEAHLQKPPEIIDIRREREIVFTCRDCGRERRIAPEVERKWLPDGRLPLCVPCRAPMARTVVERVLHART